MLMGIYKKLKLSLFVLYILFLPLINIPIRYSIPGLGQDLSNYLSLIMLFFIIYEYKKHELLLSSKFTAYVLVFFLWQLLCLVIGLACFRSDELLVSSQSTKLRYIVEILFNYGIYVNIDTISKYWIFFKQSKDIVLFDMAYIVVAVYTYTLFSGDFKKTFEFVLKCSLALVFELSLYSLIELGWLKFHNIQCRSILESINVYLYDPGSEVGWWPPLLWDNQLRSVCVEPSNFGILAAFLLPFIWLCYLKNKGINFFILNVFFCLMIAATNSRTAVIIAIIEHILLLVLWLLYYRNRIRLSVISILFVSFILGIYLNIMNYPRIERVDAFFNGAISEEIDTDDFSVKLDNYMSDNIISVGKLNQRSNNSRYAILVSQLKVIKDHPVFGVGRGLSNIYVDEHVPEFASENLEMQGFHNYMLERGVLVSGYPMLNKYTGMGMNAGIIGIFLYILPAIYLLFKTISNRFLFFNDLQSLCLFVSGIGLGISQVANTVFISCIGIVLAIITCKVKSLR